MGFMHEFKDASRPAQQAAKSAGDSVAGMGGMGGAAAKANKIAQHGVKRPAVLKGMRETGHKDPLASGPDPKARSDAYD